MLNYENLTPEWLAGFFDGEGCVCLTVHGGSYSLRINITQSDERLLTAIKEQYGASYIYPKKQRRANERQVFEVGWYGKGCRTILETLKGKVRIKAAQIELALQFLDTIIPNGDRRTESYMLRSDIREKRESLRQQMRVLNHAGPNKPATQAEHTELIQ